MGLRIATNMPSINAQKTLAGSTREIAKSSAQLASGSRITKSADDAAGLSISETFKSSIRGFYQAQRNSNDAISMVQVAEGSMNEIGNILTRFRELAVQASSDTVGDQERGFINKEVQQIKAEMERIAQSTQFGDTKLLNGSGAAFDFQVGIHAQPDENRISFDTAEINVTTDALNTADFDFSTKEGAQSALETVEQSQRQLNGSRATLGALQNRLVSTSDNLGNSIENFSAANSRVRDTDMADATAMQAKNNILEQASVGVLAQANQQPALALKLLG